MVAIGQVCIAVPTGKLPSVFGLVFIVTRNKVLKNLQVGLPVVMTCA